MPDDAVRLSPLDRVMIRLFSLWLGSCYLCVRAKPHTRGDIAAIRPEVIECRL